MVLLETETYGLMGERFFWVKSLKDSTIISCFLSVKKIALKGFDYNVEKEKRMKRAEAQIIPRGVRNTCVCIFLTPSQGLGIQGTYRVREIVTALLHTMWLLAVHSLVAIKFLSCLVSGCQWFSPEVWTCEHRKTSAKGHGRTMEVT